MQRRSRLSIDRYADWTDEVLYSMIGQTSFWFFTLVLGLRHWWSRTWDEARLLRSWRSRTKNPGFLSDPFYLWMFCPKAVFWNEYLRYSTERITGAFSPRMEAFEICLFCAKGLAILHGNWSSVSEVHDQHSVLALISHLRPFFAVGGHVPASNWNVNKVKLVYMLCYAMLCYAMLCYASN